MFNIFSIPFVITLIFYTKKVFQGHDSQEKNRLMVLAILFLCSLPIPVLFGGFSWQFFTASMYVSIIMGKSFCYCLNNFTNNKYTHSIIITLFFIWISIATVTGFNHELPKGGGYTKMVSMINVAQNSKILNNIEIIPEVVYYDTGSWKDLIWPFGGAIYGKGHLFKYLYKDRNIVEIAINDGKVIQSNKRLCNNISGEEKTLYFGFNVEKMSWRTIESRNYCKITYDK